MNQITARLAFLAALLSAGAASAGSDIVKCTGPDGRVTLSDQPCANGEAQLVLQAADAGPAAEPAAPPAAPQRLRAALPPRQPLPLPLLRPGPPARYLSHDVATLKNARAALHMLDALPRMRYQLAANH